MLSPFRHAPPRLPIRGLLIRERLDALLRERFARRLTVLVAGAGFGKTTLLAQAFERHRGAPRGHEVWIGCRPEDAQGSGFAAALCEVFALDAATVDPLAALCDSVWQRCPEEVSIVVDDAHLLGSDSEGTALLAGLVRDLPENGHLTLAARSMPELGLARYRAAGEALVLAEGELAFDAAEHDAFATTFGSTLRHEQTGGWPALTAVGLDDRGLGIARYIREEVLRDREPGFVRALARLAPLQWIDAQRLAAFTGFERAPAEFFADLPLTVMDDSGAMRLHALWTDALADVDPEWTAPELQAAWECLVDGKHYVEAVTLADRVGDDGALRAILARLTSILTMDWQKLDAAELDAIEGRLPERVMAMPHGQLFHGQRRLLADPQRAIPFMSQAREAFAATGDVEGELSALMPLAFANIFATDVGALQFIAERSEELGTAPGRALSLGTHAVLAMIGGDSERTVALLDEARRHYAAMGGNDLAMLANALLDIGQPERAIAEIEAGRSQANLYSGSLLLEAHFDARWLAGRLTPSDLAPFDDEIPEAVRTTVHAEATFLGVLAFQNASLGRLGVAARQVERAEVLVERVPFFRFIAVTGRMALLAAEGNEAAARDLLEQSLASGQMELAAKAYRHSLRGSAIAYVVSQEARERIRDWKVGPCFALALEAAEALVALRQEGETSAAARLPWEEHERFAVGLVPPFVLELALAAAAEGNERARGVATRLAEAERSALARLERARAPGVAALARELAGSVPARPADRVELRVLGPLELLRNGETIDAAELRRERVRAMLQYLVSHRRARKEEVAAALWPDNDQASAANNLRVNLNHAERVLEPARGAGTPSFLLRRVGDLLELRAGDGLDIDADRFEELVATADQADAIGSPRESLAFHERAMAQYRGDYLIEMASVGWGESERTRLRALFIRSALRVGNLHFGHAEIDAALAATERALTVDDLCEPAHRLAARCFLRRGDRSAAIETLRRAEQVMSEAGLALDPATLDLIARVSARD